MKNALKRICFCMFALLLSSGVFVACKSDVPVNKVTDIEICVDFFKEKIYKDEVVDLSKFSATIYKSINDPQLFTLDELLPDGLDTSDVGSHSFEITYNNFTTEFIYTVLPVTLVAVTFKGDALIYFLHEGVDLAGQTFTALYSDGSEKDLALELASIQFPDNLLVDSEIQKATATYQDIPFEVPFIVKTRAIETDKQYAFINSSDYAIDCAENCVIQILFREEQSSVGFEVVVTEYSEVKNIRTEKLIVSVGTAQTPNEYTVRLQIAGSAPKKYLLYLTANGIVMENYL